jgi:hypothetical protein
MFITLLCVLWSVLSLIIRPLEYWVQIPLGHACILASVHCVALCRCRLRYLKSQFLDGVVTASNHDSAKNKIHFIAIQINFILVC